MPFDLKWCYSIWDSFRNSTIRFEKDLNRGNITYLPNFQTHCQIRVMWFIYLLEHEKAKCEKNIEQTISSNEDKMCLCHKSVLKLGAALSLKISDVM